MHHPDKATSDASRLTSESYFVHLKLAQDTLINPTKRFAYDRFGPDVTQWRHCSSVRDYILVGVQSIAPYYAAGILVMIILGVLGYLEWGRYVQYTPLESHHSHHANVPPQWRYLSFISLLTFELHTITRPYFPPITRKLLTPVLKSLAKHPPLLPFQQLILARKIVLTLFIAFSQLGPLLQQPRHPSRGSQPKIERQQQLNRLDHLAQATEVEATRLLELEMIPFADDKRATADLRSRMREWLVQNRIRAEPEVRDAVGRVMVRRRAGVPAGARGA